MRLALVLRSGRRKEICLVTCLGRVMHPEALHGMTFANCLESVTRREDLQEMALVNADVKAQRNCREIH
jgi:hypothetical protein